MIHCFTLLVILLITSLCFYYVHYYEHTFWWFTWDLPTPSEVQSWDALKRYDNLYKLSRWDGFVSGDHFNRFVRSQIQGLEMSNQTSSKFYFLEVGVGVGAFAIEILKMFPGASGFGIDSAPKAIAIAKVVLPQERMRVQVGDMRQIDSRAAEFDVIFVPGAICYLLSLDEVKKAVSEFHRVLKPGGGICLSMIASETSSMGSCNTRIPKSFWNHSALFSSAVQIRMEEMDQWNLPHSMGLYSVCIKKRPHQ